MNFTGSFLEYLDPFNTVCTVASLNTAKAKHRSIPVIHLASSVDLDLLVLFLTTSYYTAVKQKVLFAQVNLLKHKLQSNIFCTGCQHSYPSISNESYEEIAGCKKYTKIKNNCNIDTQLTVYVQS